MVSREMKYYHEENRTHVSEKEYSGMNLSIQNAVNAPMDFKIYGASVQATSVQGKNLFSTKKVNHQQMLSSLQVINPNEFKLTVNREAATVPTVNFGISLKAGTYRLSFDATIKNSPPTSVRPNELFIGGQKMGAPWLYIWKLGGDCENKHFSYTLTLTENVPDGCIVLFCSVGESAFTNYEATLKNIQIEAGSAETGFEPFVPDSPSVQYPSEIVSSKNILFKCVGVGKTNSTKIPLLGYALEVSDIAKSNITVGGKYYIADYIEYDSKTDQAVRYRYINEPLLNFTLPSKDQIQAIRSVPLRETISATAAEYMFKNVKSIQSECVLSCEAYSGADEILPLNIKTKAKVMKG